MPRLRNRQACIDGFAPALLARVGRDACFRFRTCRFLRRGIAQRLGFVEQMQLVGVGFFRTGTEALVESQLQQLFQLGDTLLVGSNKRLFGDHQSLQRIYIVWKVFRCPAHANDNN